MHDTCATDESIRTKEAHWDDSRKEAAKVGIRAAVAGDAVKLLHSGTAGLTDFCSSSYETQYTFLQILDSAFGIFLDSSGVRQKIWCSR